MSYMTLTHKFLSEQIETQAINRKLTSSLRKVWVHEEPEELLSFTNFQLWKWCVEGTFDEYLKSNTYVAFPTLLKFLNQKKQTQVFGKAQDALVRHHTGARTLSEQRNQKVNADSYILPADVSSIVVSQKSENGEDTETFVVVAEPKEDTHDKTTYRSNFLRKVLGTMKASDRYTRIYNLMCEDYTVTEIAQMEGDTMTTMRAVVQTLRETLQKTCSMARLVMEQEENIIQIKDLDVEEDDSKWLKKALQVLGEDQLITYTDSTIQLTSEGIKTRDEQLLF